MTSVFADRRLPASNGRDCYTLLRAVDKPRHMVSCHRYRRNVPLLSLSSQKRTTGKRGQPKKTELKWKCRTRQIGTLPNRSWLAKTRRRHRCLLCPSRIGAGFSESGRTPTRVVTTRPGAGSKTRYSAYPHPVTRQTLAMSKCPRRSRSSTPSKRNQP